MAYRARNQVKRSVGRLKQFRRVATRYEKRGVNYLAMVKLAAVAMAMTLCGHVLVERGRIVLIGRLPGAQCDREGQGDPGRDDEDGVPDAFGGGDPESLAGEAGGAGVGDEDEAGQTDRGADAGAGGGDAGGDALLVRADAGAGGSSRAAGERGARPRRRPMAGGGGLAACPSASSRSYRACSRARTSSSTRPALAARARSATNLASTSSSAMPAAQPCPGSSVIASSWRSRWAPHSAWRTSSKRQYGAQPSWTATPANPGSTPA